MPSLKFMKIFPAQVPSPMVTGLETIMNPISDASVSASIILWVAKIYTMRKTAGISDAAP